jgi:hypothetical protein
MSLAMIHPEGAKLKRKGGSLETKDQFSSILLSQARTVLAYTRNRKVN